MSPNELSGSPRQKRPAIPGAGPPEKRVARNRGPRGLWGLYPGAGPVGKGLLAAVQRRNRCAEGAVRRTRLPRPQRQVVGQKRPGGVRRAQPGEPCLTVAPVPLVAEARLALTAPRPDRVQDVRRSKLPRRKRRGFQGARSTWASFDCAAPRGDPRI